MFSKFFDWLKKKEKCESKRDFEKVDIDNANEININTSTKANCEIVKDLTTNVVSNDSVIKNSITKENFTKENFAKSLFDAKERLSSMREIYYATNIAGRIIKKVLDRGIAVVQWDKNSLGDLSGNILDCDIFVDFGKIYRLKGLKFMQKGVIVESGIIEKMSDGGNRSWEINVSIPEFYEVKCCENNDSRDNDSVDNDDEDNGSNAKFKIVRWEERDIVNEFRKEIESVINCECEQNFKVINKGVCKFVNDEGLVRKVVKEVIWEEFGWSESGVRGKNLSNENFGKVFFPKTGEWVDVKSKCEDVNGEFIGKICREIIEGVKRFGVGREKFGVENDGLNDNFSDNLSNKDYRRLTVNLKIRKGEIWKIDSGNSVRNRWEELGKDVKEIIGSVGKEKFFDIARKTSELMRYVEEKYGVEKVEEIKREVENGNRKIRECRREIERIVGRNEWISEMNDGCWDNDGCWNDGDEDSEALIEATRKMEEVVGEVQERLREVMGEEIWEMYKKIIGEE